MCSKRSTSRSAPFLKYISGESTQLPVSQRRAFGTFVAFIVAAILLKLWLVSGIRKLPTFGPHDASNFIDHMKGILHGAWFGEYNNLTLIKAPFSPLYLALIHELGVPLSLANELFYAGACFVA